MKRLLRRLECKILGHSWSYIDESPPLYRCWTCKETIAITGWQDTVVS